MTATPLVAGIVLAAGRGTRFGESPKLLAELDGKPLVRHAVEASLSASLPTLVVLGDREAEIRAALADLSVTFVVNRDYTDGLSTSLRAGFAALPSSTEAAIILLGDMPRIDHALLGRLIAVWEETARPSAIVPLAGGRRGNPALLSRRLAPEIAQLTGDTGASPLLKTREDVVQLPIDEPGVLSDVDTPEALAQLARGPAT